MEAIFLIMNDVARGLQQLSLDAKRPIPGDEEALNALRELILWPSLYAKEGETLGVEWPRGLLLYGPPGCGKTLMTQEVCNQCNAVLKTVSASSIFGAFIGESEKTLRGVFEEAADEAVATGNTVVLFFDEIDALCPKRGPEMSHETRVVSQMLTLMDGLASRGRDSNGRTVMIAATNRPNAIDAALRRPGRFDREVEVRIPDQEQRLEILKFHSAEMPLEASLDLKAVAERTHGYTGADLCALCREAAMHAISDSPCDQTGKQWIALKDFEAALQLVPPSVCRSYEVEVAAVQWDDIGGLDDVKKKLRQAAEWPLLHRDAFERLGLQPAKGILLYGPPGCCKTTLASAVATACKAHLFPLSCAQVYSMYSGEGEAIVRDTFRRARISAPSIVLLDEVDAMACCRARSDGKSGLVERRLLSCLLTEMDGLEKTTDILVMAATNRPDALDAAILRPGRLDLLLYVGLPDEPSRLQILGIMTKCTPLHSDVDLSSIASETENFSGAELGALCSEAALAALREDVVGASTVNMKHFRRALEGIQPAADSETIERYRQWGMRNKKR